MTSVEIESGRMQPLPDFIGYLRAAERLNCTPWDMLDGKGPPKRWWMAATMTLAVAETDARQRSQNR